MMLIVALISQMPEFHLIQYFLTEKEVDDEHERLTNAETSGLLWLSHSTSVNSYGVRNSASSQPYRRQTNDNKEEPANTIDIVTNWPRRRDRMLVLICLWNRDTFFAWLENLLFVLLELMRWIFFMPCFDRLNAESNNEMMNPQKIFPISFFLSDEWLTGSVLNDRSVSSCVAVYFWISR